MNKLCYHARCRAQCHAHIRTISIIGAGRVGQTIAKRLRKLGWQIGAVVTRSRRSARAAVRAIGAGTPHASLTPEAFNADVILLSVPDDVLENVAQKLAKISRAALAKKSRATIILHTSGALDHRVLAPLARRGASTGSMHPMQTFSGRNAPRLEGVIFSIEGAPAACAAAQKIARSLGGTPVIIKSQRQTCLPRFRYRSLPDMRCRSSSPPPKSHQNRLHAPPRQPSPAPINPPNAG